MARRPDVLMEVSGGYARRAATGEVKVDVRLVRQARGLPLLLWPLGVAVQVVACWLLFRGDGDVPTVAVLNTAVGGSFVACGLIAWQHRPGNPTGVLMTLAGFLFFAEPLMSEVDTSV